MRVQTTKVKELTDTQVQTLFTSILSHIPKTLPFITDITSNFWYSFKYIRNYYKYILPHVYDLIEADTSLATLGTIIGEENDERWYRLARAYFQDYDPLTDYSRTELHVGNDSHTDEEKINTDMETTIDQTVSAKFYGFNSNDAVPVSDTDTDATNTQSGTKTTNTKDFTRTGNDSHTTTVKGYSESPTKLLDEEYRARSMSLVEVIMQDISNYVCVQVY